MKAHIQPQPSSPAEFRTSLRERGKEKKSGLGSRNHRSRTVLPYSMHAVDYHFIQGTSSCVRRALETRVVSAELRLQQRHSIGKLKIPESAELA